MDKLADLGTKAMEDQKFQALLARSGARALPKGLNKAMLGALYLIFSLGKRPTTTRTSMRTAAL